MKALNEGLWPVMLTPFTGNKELDIDGLKALTEYYVRSGSGGLFANCLSSEMFHLTEKERILIAKTVVDTAGPGIPVVATGTFSDDINKNAGFIKKIFDTGIKAVIINTNQLNQEKDNDDEFLIKLEALVDQTEGIPLGIYECPVPYKRLVSDKVMKWIASSGRFLYFKDTSCDAGVIDQRLGILQNSPMGLYNANMATGLGSMIKGAKGLSPIGANFFPELYVFFVKFFNDENFKNKIDQLNSFLCVADPLVHHVYPFAAKWMLQQRGLDIETVTRANYGKIEAQDYIKLDHLKKLCEQKMKELGIENAV